MDTERRARAYLSAPTTPKPGELSSDWAPRASSGSPRAPGPIDLGDQTDARSFPPPRRPRPAAARLREIGPAVPPRTSSTARFPRPQLRFYAAFVLGAGIPAASRALAQHAFDPDAECA